MLCWRLEAYPSDFLRTYVNITEGKGPGYNSGYTTQGLVLDFGNNTLHTFVDARFHLLNNNHRWATNLGLGVRYWSPFFERVFGCNAFYDFRKIYGSYQQYGAGIEMLGDDFDIRINGYFPTSRKKHFKSPHTFSFPGGFSTTCRRYHQPLTGGDAEIGSSFSCWNHYDCFYPYIGIGSYFYSQKCHNVVGGKFRLGIHYANRFSFEIRTAYDSTFKTSLQVVFSFGINFDQKLRPAQDCDNIYDQPIERQEIIVNSKEFCCWHANW